MHNIDIPGWAVERVIKRRGAEHVYQDLDPARTALIVIDMQNAFMLPGVARTLRAAGGTVVWIMTTYTDEVSVAWSAYYGLSTQENGTKRSNALVKGTKGHQLWDALEVLPYDPTIEKNASQRLSRDRANSMPTSASVASTR